MSARRNAAMFGLLMLAACHSGPLTDDALKAEAEHLVEARLQKQANFSMMESVAAQNIVCGHVVADNVPGHGSVDQDFVYRDGKLLMDDDSGFDGAALACDLAAGGSNAADAENIMAQ